ncbi:MAG: hypothetical protein IRY98_00290 [Alicyclobacillaceae bacterium]|nr:hypothetical protein [Alicyclobacillaceae bacterium]
MIEFLIEDSVTVFQDPTKNWEITRRTTQIRKDPLTGIRTRILDYPVRLPDPPDLSDLAEQTAQTCPFCRPRVTEVTPKYLPEVCPEGRFERGEAVLFPNMFPYDENSAVAVFSNQHYVRMSELTADYLMDGFLTAGDYAAALNRAYPGKKRYFSLNWNYLPVAGASIIHPHYQIVAGHEPTNYHDVLLRASAAFYDVHKVSYWPTLVAAEQEKGERYLGRTGKVDWLVAFAPRGLLEVVGVAEDCARVEEMTPERWRDLSEGLARIFHHFAEKRFPGFNLTLFSGLEEDREHYRLQVRVVPRVVLSAIGTNEVNYFKMLHEECLTMMRPEEVAAEMRRAFA